jgi:aminoglycoside phosphotransferase (APT) family kinase protein
VSQGGDRGPWILELSTGDGDVEVVVKIAADDDADGRDGIACTATALQATAGHDVPAPRLLAADADGTASGVPALLTTRVPGSSVVVRDPTPARLRSLGALAAAIHAVAVEPSPTLPPRRRSLDGYDLRGDRRTTSTPLLDRAVAVLDAEDDGPHRRHAPAGLVHGDLWQGNTLWEHDRLTGVVDWDFAGVGPAGIDLGSLRCDVALLHGGPAADLVLEGWEERAGRPADDVAWWDVVAGAATPDDLGGWLPNFHAQGRPDLDLDTVTDRRDRFLTAALRRLEG